MGRQQHTLVEEQIARWERQRQAEVRARAREFTPPNVITLSNEFGSRGIAVARRVGARLSMPVYDREIVEPRRHHQEPAGAHGGEPGPAGHGALRGLHQRAVP